MIILFAHAKAQVVKARIFVKGHSTACVYALLPSCVDGNAVWGANGLAVVEIEWAICKFLVKYDTIGLGKSEIQALLSWDL